VLAHPKAGAILVDSGVGGPDRVLTDWRVVNVSVADALDAIGLAPGDVKLVINSHLHFDHCGQNAVFKHAPFYVQRTELERAVALCDNEPERALLAGRLAALG